MFLESLNLRPQFYEPLACSLNLGMQDESQVPFLGLLVLCTVDGSALQEAKVLLVSLSVVMC